MTVEQEDKLIEAFRNLQPLYELWWYNNVNLPLKVKKIIEIDEEDGPCAILINGNYVNLFNTDASEFKIVTNALT